MNKAAHASNIRLLLVARSHAHPYLAQKGDLNPPHCFYVYTIFISKVAYTIGIMDFIFGKDKILFSDKELTLLDELVIKFTKLIKFKYVIVSGYLAILFGRETLKI